jgi:hypothetical protein
MGSQKNTDFSKELERQNIIRGLAVGYKLNIRSKKK